MADLTLQSTIRQADHLLATELDGETVVMGIEQGNYYGMEATARDIWMRIREPRRVDALCRELASRYAVDLATCERDVLDFLEQALAEGLIVVD
jgi:hypothetical protein